MKSYTDVKQSLKLAEILPLESADMWWNWFSDPFDEVNGGEYTTEPLLHKPVCNPEKVIPCWSLAALLGILHFPVLRYDIEDDEGGWIVSCEKNDKRYLSYYKDNPVDTCYEMILRLHSDQLLL